MTTKEIIAATYFSLSLFATICEPTGKAEISFVAWYYSIAIINLAIAVYILNRVIKKTDANTTATNRNRIP